MSTFNLNSIDQLIREQKPFAVYRLPEEADALAFCGENLRLIRDMNELNGARGFVVAPFRVSEKHPIVLLEAPQDAFPCAVSDLEDNEPETTDTGNIFYEKCSEKYAARYGVFHDALENGGFDKLVLSRCEDMKKPHDFSLGRLFRSACRLYHDSYIYLCYTPQTGVWLGASPEVILAGESRRWSVVALAGTQPVLWNVLPEKWDAKNRREQALVVSYLRSVLESLLIKASEYGPRTVQAGALAHLKTEFDFAMEDHDHLGRLLEMLHPTPAVCGLPKEESARFIEEHEGYDRGYYSGFVGWLDPEHRSDLYVNLRCVQVLEDTLRLYAGGGLLRNSDMESEWRETENKLHTMKRIIGEEDDSDEA